MKNPIKEKILEEFDRTFLFNEDAFLNEVATPRHVKLFLLSALDRYAREVIKEILPCKESSIITDELWVAHDDGFNSCISEIQKRADELLGKEEIVIVTAPCCKHIGFTSTCCCHCHPSSPNTYTAK